jgi:iron complex outermembrane receptor protein
MKSIFTRALLMSTAIAGGAMPAAVFAQAAAPERQPQAVDQDAASFGSGEIIVTARRRSETLQDVPQTINAVSSDTIEKLRINNASDIANIVPGISIEGGSSGSGGFGSSTSVRGVPTFLNSNATPVVQFYLNDAPTGRGPEVTQSLFDIDQIEVLKGPQGTLRGRSAPSGAITITTKRPDLDEVGGYVNMSGSTRGNINAQAAVGVPIIRDVLALRVAGVVDHNEANGVTSANNRADPYVRSQSLRATLRFEPTSNVSATVMYQRLERASGIFTQAAGPGNGINGPAIAAGDRLAITDGAAVTTAHTDFFVGQAEWRFGGQKLNYVGSYRDGQSNARSPQDSANVLRGIEYYQTTQTPAKERSHELRLSSEERIAEFLDYTLGGFYDKETSEPRVQSVAAFLSGAFGRPGTVPVRGEPNLRYSLPTAISISPTAIEKSVFANLTAHIGDKTELSAGGRYIRFTRDDRFSLATGSGFNAITNPAIPSPAFCGFLPGVPAGTAASPVYTGLPAVCDIPIAARTLQNVSRQTKSTPFLYNISLSHRFAPDFLVYANTGTAFRTAGPTIGITSALTCCSAPSTANLGTIEDLIFHKPERSTSYEAGFKATFLERRARLNVSIFQQKFRNFYFLTQATRYLGVTDPTNPATGTVNSSEFTADAKAKVRGIDIEAGFQITPRWNVNLGYSWSKAKLADALIPCNDGNFDGNVDSIVPTVQNFINAGTLVARCRSSEAISRTPRWNLTIQSEYSAKLSSSIDGFIRGNFNYYPDNPNSSQGIVIDKYSLLNLYLGIRPANSAWEVSLFANNVLNTKQILSVNPVAVTSSGGVNNFFPGVSGYNSIAYTPRREVGMLLRYAFGSR